MYPCLREDLRAASRDARSRWRRRPQVGRNVLFIGLTSLLTDISSEMVVAVLPVYLLATA